MKDLLMKVSKASVDNAADDYSRSLRALRGRARERGTLAPNPEDMDVQMFLGNRRHKTDVPYRKNKARATQYLAPYTDEDGTVKILDGVPFDEVRGRIAEMTGKDETAVMFHVLSDEQADLLQTKEK